MVCCDVCKVEHLNLNIVFSTKSITFFVSLCSEITPKKMV